MQFCIPLLSYDCPDHSRDIRIQIQRIQSRFLKVPMVISEDTNTSRLDIEVRSCFPNNVSTLPTIVKIQRVGFTKRKRELNPARNKDSIEMPMCDDENVADAYAVLEVFPMGFVDLHMYDDGQIIINL